MKKDQLDLFQAEYLLKLSLEIDSPMRSCCSRASTMGYTLKIKAAKVPAFEAGATSKVKMSSGKK